MKICGWVYWPRVKVLPGYWMFSTRIICGKRYWRIFGWDSYG